nr:hypothetical protein [Tanacetum cinerariifolium]
MVAILEKSEQNVDFHPIVDFIEASLLMYALTVKHTVYVSHICQFWSTARIETTEDETKILATVDGILRTDEGSGIPIEPHHTPSPEAHLTSHTTHSSSTLPLVTTASIPTVTPSKRTPIRQYTQRARIAQSSALLPVANEPTSPLRDVSEGEACPIDSSFRADQDRENIAKTSTLPYDSAPRELEINKLKARVKLLEDKEGVDAERSRDDASIKGRNLDEGEAAAERVSNDTEEMATVLTTMDAATVLAIPTAGLIFATGTVVTPYTRRKGKETLVESKTPKKKKIKEQMDIQMARQLEEEMKRDA